MHNGPTRHDARCCGSSLHVVALTRDDGDRSLVELVRCSACGLSSWRLDGVEAAKDAALGAISRVYATTAPRPAPVRTRRPAVPALRPATPVGAPATGRAALATGAAATAPRELADLLAGWQVHGTI